MSRFDYRSLYNMELNGDKVGDWNRAPVFASCKSKLLEKGTGAYYIVYDDHNAIVKKMGDTWYKHGTVSEIGEVNEISREIYLDLSKNETKMKTEMKYHYDTETYEPHAVCGKDEAECNGEMKIEDEVIGDVKLGIDVDKTLEAARTMTVNSLLEGFNYGLVEESMG